MKTKSLDLILASALILVVVTGFAHTWRQTNPSLSFGSSGMSADGRIICVLPSSSHAVISTDSGNTWFVATNSAPWGTGYLGPVAVSADGSKIFAVQSSNTTLRSSIFLSADHGTNWSQTAFPSTTTATKYSIACSADGTKVIAALRNGSIFYSTNGGVVCYTSSVPAQSWTWLASSADGSRMFAVADVGGLYSSSDFGVDWTSANPPVPGFNSVCTSSDGKWIGLTASATYISSNGGLTWRTNNFGGQIISCSANGTNWIIAGNNIYTSVDAGVTWTTNFSNGQWSGGLVSADGAEMMAMGTGQGTFIGLATPSPQMNIQSQDPNVALSWIIPSTNFVLQQSAALANPVWTQVTNNPVLNFTNLNEEVTVPVNGSNTFFRLSAQ